MKREELMSFIVDSIGVDGGFYECFRGEGDEGPIHYGSPKADIEFMNDLYEELLEEVGEDEILIIYHRSKGEVKEISMTDLIEHDLVDREQIKYKLIMREIDAMSSK